MEGVVVKLESGEASTDGTVVVACLVDGRMRQVGLSLGGDAYARALEAHGMEKQVAAEGELSQKGRRLVLRNARNLRVLEDD